VRTRRGREVGGVDEGLRGRLHGPNSGMIEIYFRCFHKRRPKISSSFPSLKPPYMPYESVSVLRRHFKCLLLSDKEFGNLSWEPPGRLEEFCRERLRPVNNVLRTKPKQHTYHPNTT
jgi:hypothetical protein